MCDQGYNVVTMVILIVSWQHCREIIKDHLCVVRIPLILQNVGVDSSAE